MLFQLNPDESVLSCNVAGRHFRHAFYFFCALGTAWSARDTVNLTLFLPASHLSFITLRHCVNERLSDTGATVSARHMKSRRGLRARGRKVNSRTQLIPAKQPGGFVANPSPRASRSGGGAALPRLAVMAGYGGYDPYSVVPAVDPYGASMSYVAPYAAYAAPPVDDIRTIFITGFPADVKERELNNLMRFLPGYEVRRFG